MAERVIMITIGADGRAALKEMGEVEEGGKRLGSTLGNIAIPAATIAAVYALGAAVKTVVTESMQYLGQMETATLGIATSFMTGGQYVDEITGKVMVGTQALAAAQEDSAATMAELQVANMKTIATLDQLVQAYQVALPVAMSKGFDRKQVMDFTVAVVQAAGAIGVPLHQLSQEMRALLTGESWQDARIGQVLGLRPSDINELKGDAEGLFSMLMQKLDAYKTAGSETSKTWDGLWSNAKDIAMQAGGQAFEPLFDAVKDQLTDITSSLVTIDEKTGQIKWNEGFVGGIETVRSGINAVVAETYRIGMLIDLAGGSLTSFGMVALKVAEIMTRFVTIGQFGDSLKSGAEAMARWNKVYEQRYKDSEKALQALADREAGLNALAEKTNARFKQNPGTGDEEKANETRRAKLEAALGRNLSTIKAGLEKETEAYKTQEKELELLLAQRGITEADFYSKKIGLEQAALAASITALEKQKAAIVSESAAKVRLLKEEKDRVKEQGETKAKVAAIETEIEKKRQEAARKGIDLKIRTLEEEQRLALASARIAEDNYQAQVAWLEKLDAYKVKSGKLDEGTAIANRYDRERKTLALQLESLAVELSQVTAADRRVELEAERLRLQERIKQSKVEEANETAIFRGNEKALAFEHSVAMQDIAQTGLVTYLQFLGREQEALEAHYNWQQEQLDLLYAHDMASQELSHTQKLSREREYQRRSLALQIDRAQKQRELDRSEYYAKASYAQTAFSNMANAMDIFYALSAQKSLAAFRAYQVMKSGETIISTASLAVKAFDDGAKTNYWLGVAYAAAAVAYGGAQLAQIWSASPNGGSSSASVGAAAAPTAASSGSSAAPSQPAAQPDAAPVYNIHLYGINYGLDTDKLARDIYPAIKRAANDGVR